MLNRDTVVTSPHSVTVTRRNGKTRRVVHDPRTSVTMKAHGLELVLFFDDLSAAGPVREVRLLPGESELTPQALARLIPQAPLYADYARAVVQSRDGDVREALVALREIGSTRRGLGDEFFRIVASQYGALVSEGEEHPVKALADLHHVVISTASRWIKEARRRGYIEEANDA